MPATPPPGADRSDDGDLLTTSEAARILGVSRQHVVDLCNRGDLPHATVGAHRRIRRGDVEAFGSQGLRLTREERKRLWLGHAIAGKLVMAPEASLFKARQRLRSLPATDPAARVEDWERLLHGPLEGILAALTSTTPRARELREHSPFDAVLSAEEHDRLDGAFSARSRREGQSL